LGTRGDDDVNFETDQLGGEVRQPFVFPFRISVLDDNVFPFDIPVEQPKKFEFIVNLKSAKQIGVTIPPNVLARADRVLK